MLARLRAADPTIPAGRVRQDHAVILADASGERRRWLPGVGQRSERLARTSRDAARSKSISSGVGIATCEPQH